MTFYGVVKIKILKEAGVTVVESLDEMIRQCR
jgi:hypothetical protein